MFGAVNTEPRSPLKDDEARLLRAYRRVLKGDKVEALAGLERRAREIEELESRIVAERAPARDASGKRGPRAA